MSKCERCKYEDTEKCDTCTDPDRDEIKLNLQKILEIERERIGGKPIEQEAEKETI